MQYLARKKIVGYVVYIQHFDNKKIVSFTIWNVLAVKKLLIVLFTIYFRQILLVKKLIFVNILELLKVWKIHKEKKA